MTTDFGQHAHAVRFDWGPQGATAVAPGAAVVVVVDVLSFTTTLTVAVERGIDVLPFPWRDAVAAAATAARHDAVLAVDRSAAGPGEVSLSPQTLRHAGPQIRRLVLPSPNGSAISAALAATGATVVGAALRNFGAAARWVHREAAGRPVAVVAAGERWPDDTLRPAIEDLWGAGAFLDAYLSIAAAAPSPGSPPAASPEAAAAPAPSCHGSGGGDPVAAAGVSPEAAAARAAYRWVAGSLSEALLACGSGRELVRLGYGGDVAVAAEAAASNAVPVLRDRWFVDGGSERDHGSG